MNIEAPVISKVAILGSGKFGCALANIIKGNNIGLQLWARRPKQVDGLPISNDLAEVLKDADVVIFAIPSAAFYDVTKSAAPLLEKHAFCISATKGLDPVKQVRMSQVLAEFVPAEKIGVLSGPNLATEIIQQKITASVIASGNTDLIEVIQQVLVTDYLRVYSSHDVIGVEWAGLLKNIYAILYGFAAQMDLGDNARGVLLSRSLAEMSRFGTANGADTVTFMGLAGIGDLITTCSSPLSRNYQVGSLLAQGKSIDEAVEIIGETAEGINTVSTIYKLSNEQGISMPLATELYGVLFQGVNINDALNDLMRRPQTADN